MNAIPQMPLTPTLSQGERGKIRMSTEQSPLPGERAWVRGLALLKID